MCAWSAKTRLGYERRRSRRANRSTICRASGMPQAEHDAGVGRGRRAPERAADARRSAPSSERPSSLVERPTRRRRRRRRATRRGAACRRSRRASASSSRPPSSRRSKPPRRPSARRWRSPCRARCRRCPSGLQSASETTALTTSEPSASAVGSHGRWSEKNVRVSMQVEAAERQAEGEPEQRLGGQLRSSRRRTRRAGRRAARSASASTSIAAAAGISSSAIWRMPMPMSPAGRRSRGARRAGRAAGTARSPPRR